MATSDRPAGWYRFGLFEVDERRAEVRKQGLRIRLRGRPFEILLILLEHHGELVTRDELRNRLWPADTFVDFDHGLNTAVNRLREMLGDSAENPRFIETVPRKGYRFVAPVEVLTVRDAPAIVAVSPPNPVASVEPDAEPVVSQTPPPEAALPPLPAAGNVRRLRATVVSAAVLGAIALGLVWGTRGRPATSPPGAAPVQMRLVVLPFENLSGDVDQDFFSDGFTEEMIAELGALEPSRLGVIARTTSMRYKATTKDIVEIGRELGVDYVLEGSVRRAGDRLRITAQLIEAKSQTHLWADSYDRKLMDVIDIQADVAMAIAQSLGSTLTTRGALSGRTMPASFNAYELMLRGRFFREQATEASVRKAIEYFDRAVAADPAFAPAYAALSDAYRLLGAPGWEVEAPAGPFARAKEYAERALALDPSSPEALAALAMVRFTCDWNVPEGERIIKDAIRRNPSFAKAHQYYSGMLTVARRFDESIAEAARALELDPLSATAGTTLGIRYLYAGRTEDAEREFRRTLEVNPSFAVAHWGLAQVLREKGKADEHLDELTRAVTLSDNSGYMRAHLGYGYAVTGDRERAMAIARELEGEGPARYVAPYHMALIAAGLSDTAAAMRWLTRAFDDGSGWMGFLPVQPEFDKVRQAPEIQRLLARVLPRN